MVTCHLFIDSVWHSSQFGVPYNELQEGFIQVIWMQVGITNKPKTWSIIQCYILHSLIFFLVKNQAGKQTHQYKLFSPVYKQLNSSELHVLGAAQTLTRSMRAERVLFDISMSITRWLAETRGQTLLLVVCGIQIDRESWQLRCMIAVTIYAFIVFEWESAKQQSSSIGLPICQQTS